MPITFSNPLKNVKTPTTRLKEVQLELARDVIKGAKPMPEVNAKNVMFFAVCAAVTMVVAGAIGQGACQLGLSLLPKSE